MKKTILKHIKWVVLAVFLLTITALLEVWFAFALKDIIDVASYGSLNDLLLKLGLMVLLILGDFAFSSFAGFAQRSFSCKVISDLRRLIVEQTLTLDFKNFRVKQTSFYTNLLTNDIDSLDTDYLSQYIKGFFNVIQILLSTVAVIYLNIGRASWREKVYK